MNEKTQAPMPERPEYSEEDDRGNLTIRPAVAMEIYVEELERYADSLEPQIAAAKAAAKAMAKQANESDEAADENARLWEKMKAERDALAHSLALAEGEKLQLNEIMAPIAAPLSRFNEPRLGRGSCPMD